MLLVCGWRKLAVVVAGFAVILSGCSLKSDDGSVSTSKYNSLVEDYNKLVKNYNAQASRNTKGDDAIRSAGDKLMDLDDEISSFQTNLSAGYDLIRDSKCDEAKKLIEGKVTDQMSGIADKCNELSQGAMEKALARIAADTSPYNEYGKSLATFSAKWTKTRISGGLAGMKSFSVFSRNKLADEYNRVCAATKPKVPESRPETPAPKPGVVTVDRSGKREELSPEEFRNTYRGRYDEKAYSDFNDFATSSGGTVGFSPTPELFSKTVDVIFQQIIDRSGSQTDVVIVLDTTSSMEDDIDNVKANMKRLVAQLKTKSREIGLKLGLVLYRDQGDAYVTQLASDLTENLDVIDKAIQGVKVAGGGDEPEAVLDALMVANEKVSWRAASKRSVILIGDAPGHEKSNGGLSKLDVMHSYKRAGLGIVVYPIVVSK